MGAVSDRLTVTLDEARTYLRAEFVDVEAGILDALIDAAKEDADSYLNNDFVVRDEDGTIVEVLPIPKRVKVWVLQSAVRDYEQRTSGLKQESSGVGLATWSKRDYSDLARLRKNPGY